MRYIEVKFEADPSFTAYQRVDEQGYVVEYLDEQGYVLFVDPPVGVVCYVTDPDPPHQPWMQ